MEPNSRPGCRIILNSLLKNRGSPFMTGVCAFTSNSRDEALLRVNTMLAAMQMRGIVGETVAGEIEGVGDVVIGMCKLPSAPIAKIRKGGNTFRVLDGDLSLQETSPSPDSPLTDDVERLFGTYGPFAFLGFDGAELVAALDALGQKPLYWGIDEHGSYGFASLKTALNSIGVDDSKPVFPGQVVELSRRGLTMSTDHVLTKPEHREISEAEALGQMEKLLLDAVARMVPKRSGLAFSGGLDSALVAAACKKLGLEPELITVGMTGQPELEHAAKAASFIGLQSKIKRLTEDDVVKALPDVVRTVENDSPVTVGISLPFYFACQLAHESGFEVIVAGQLSDELFGGYARFEEIALSQGLDKADLAMWTSVLAAAEGDFAPGDKVASSCGLELRCPFAYFPLVEAALQLPVCLRVNVSGTGVTRKYILRRLAEKWGLPASIVNRRKKAVQYSSGVQKVLVKEARRKGRKLRDLLSTSLMAQA